MERDLFEGLSDMNSKEAGMHAFLHTDGVVTDIIPDLIEIGLDTINLSQPRMLGIKKIGDKFAGKITFFSLVDTQATLINGTKKDIEEEVKLLMKHWAVDSGGFIACDYGDFVGLGTEKEKIKWMYDAFIRYDRYKYKNLKL